MRPSLTLRIFLGGIAQLGERLHGMQEVSGSIPLISTKIKIPNAGFKSGLAVRKAGFCSKIATLKVHRSPSSRGLGHLPFTEATGVRIPVGTPQIKTPPQGGFFICGNRANQLWLVSLHIHIRLIKLLIQLIQNSIAQSVC